MEFLPHITFACTGSTFGYPYKKFLIPRPTRTKFNPRPPLIRTHNSAGSCTRSANAGLSKLKSCDALATWFNVSLYFSITEAAKYNSCTEKADAIVALNSVELQPLSRKKHSFTCFLVGFLAQLVVVLITFFSFNHLKGGF